MVFSICLSVFFENWRGDLGNYFLVVTFLIASALNVFVASVTHAYNRNKGNGSVNLIIELLLGNACVAGAQVANTLIRLFTSLKCYQKIIIYLIHQVGMQLAASALLSIAYIHYLLVAQLLPVNRQRRLNIVKRIIIYQSISILIGIIFIAVPFVATSKFAFSLSVLYEMSLYTSSIIYCWISRRTMRRIKESELSIATYTRKLKGEAVSVHAAAIIASILKLLSITASITIAVIKNLRHDVFIGLKWARIGCYATLLLLPIVFIVLRKETKDFLLSCLRNTDD